jgi:hypothetical protein
MRKLLFVAAALGLASCASAGIKVDEAQVKGFEKGRATSLEIIKALGTPTERSFASDGTSKITYTYAESQIRPATFIPIVGLFAGGSDTRHSAVVFEFNKEGILTDYASSEGVIGASVGPQ